MRGQRPVPFRGDGDRVGQEIPGQRAGRPGGGHQGRQLPPDLAGRRRQARLQHAGGQAYSDRASTLVGQDDNLRPSQPRPARADTGPVEQRCREAGRDHHRRVGGPAVHRLLSGAERSVRQRQLPGDRGAAGQAALHLLADVDLPRADHRPAVLVHHRHRQAAQVGQGIDHRPDVEHRDQHHHHASQYQRQDPHRPDLQQVRRPDREGRPRRAARSRRAAMSGRNGGFAAHRRPPA